MRAKELLPDDITVYVDMDGVLADLFNHAGSLHDVEHYSSMTKDQWETFFKDSNAYELFKGLPAFPSANRLLQIVTDFAGGYTILSSPLSFDKAGSIKGKREWLQKHIHVPAENIIFEHEKYKYATSNGKPNILIDDYGVNIRAWEQAGGIAIKYQADEDSLSKVFKALTAASKQSKTPREITSPDVDEGWKDIAAAGALATGLAFGGAGNADAKSQPTTQKPNVIQQVSKKDIAKSVTGNPHEVYLKKAAEKAGIAGHELTAFLSQCAHETLDFKHMKEIGGSLDFRKYDPKYAPRKAKQLGNKQVGDGAKYKGRGYIQLTGRDNYKKAGQALGLPLEKHPEMVEKPEVAAKVAVWYWKNRVAPKVDSFKDNKAVTKTINPGMKHLDQRADKLKSFQVAMK
jgi:predicted chitinase/5'(3')-deoxyribonucleotidase